MKFFGRFLFPAVLLSAFLFTSLSAKVVILTGEENQSGARVKFPFFIYQDEKCHNYFPTGWMGDHGDLHMIQAEKSRPRKGSSAIRISYSARQSQKKGWAGIYWQNPMNNWGEVKGGFDLTGAKYLYFYARGEEGGETVEFKMGGISGSASFDTASASSGELILTRYWRLYAIPLAGRDLKRIVGGFCVLFSGRNTPNGCTLYLDNILYSDQEISE